jgi:hypothetical protein
MRLVLFLVLFAGEKLTLDADLLPRFTPHQIASTAAATRAGLERWARTQEGRAILVRLDQDDRIVIVREDPQESSPGRAPQPSLETLLSANNRKVRKRYELVLNPAIAAQYDNPSAIDLGLPHSASDVMALAWAGEMLHIDFYARGVPLPPHERPDFQERWTAVAAQLRLPNATHGE